MHCRRAKVAEYLAHTYDIHYGENYLLTRAPSFYSPFCLHILCLTLEASKMMDHNVVIYFKGYRFFSIFCDVFRAILGTSNTNDGYCPVFAKLGPFRPEPESLKFA